MKKMKKIAATILCLGLVISTLCACSSMNNDGEQPAEEPTTKQTESVTESSQSMEESTEETTQEPTTVAPEQNTITGFFQIQFADDVRNNPEVLFNYDEYIYRCSVYPTDITLGDFQLDETKFRNPYTIAADPILNSSETYSVNFYVYNNSGSLGCCFQYGDTTQYLSFAFAPVWYNESKGVIVGWMPERGTYELVELYYDVEFNEMNAYGVQDMSEYDF